MSNAALMDAATEAGRRLRRQPASGGFILPGFLPGFDAAATLVKVLDLLAQHDATLSDVVAELPAVHVVHETVVTPWEQKGAVMRTLVEQSKDREVELVDGVKVLHDDGWALALPDPEEPVTHVWAEADSDADGPAAGPGVRPPHPPDGALTRTSTADPRRRREVGRRGSGRRSADVRPDGRSGSVRGHERPRGPALLDRPRVGPGRGRPGAASASPTTPRTRWATWSSSRCPRSGAEVEATAKVSEVESTKSVSDIYAPVAGTIVEVNADLADSPERLNDDPYGEGWICVIEPSPIPSAVDALLDAAAYRRVDRGIVRTRRGRASSATTAGTGTRWVRTSARRAARRSSPRPPEHTTITFHPVDPPTRSRRRSPSTSTRCPPTSGCSSCSGARRPGSRFALDDDVTTAGRHPDSDIFLDDITVSRRHAEIERTRRRLRGPRRRARSTAPTSTASASTRPPLAQRRRAPDRQVQAGVLPRRGPTSEPMTAERSPPVDRRGPQLLQDGVPRRHDLQDPLPREPGPARPRAHPVGLPEVLRRRHRAAALDPAPAARELPAAEGHQGPPGLG